MLSFMALRMCAKSHGTASLLVVMETDPKTRTERQRCSHF